MSQATFNLQIPKPNSIPNNISLSTGQILYVLGANGSGKSSLMHHIYSQFPAAVKRITAHRQTWFNSNLVEMAPSQLSVYRDQHIPSQDRLPNSRWMDSYSAQRSQITLSGLIESENSCARKAKDAIHSGDEQLIESFKKTSSPLQKLNSLLQAANLKIDISIGDDGKLFAKRNNEVSYSVAELSDGERNAILLITDVLTAKVNTLLIIDEPEKHLHRSIISPLLSYLFKERTDCTFIVSTHDISLPADNPNAKILLVRGCEWVGENCHSWDADILESSNIIPDDLKHDVLGARRNILFVEGMNHSTDNKLYSVLFPDLSIVSKGSCKDVQAAVKAIQDNTDFHWIKAYGIIDADDRNASEIESLKRNNIFALPFYSIESLYYTNTFRCKIINKVATDYNIDESDLHQQVLTAALAEFKRNTENLCSYLCEREIKQGIIQPKLPTRDEILGKELFQPYTGIDLNKSIDLALHLNKEIAHFNSLISVSDIEGLIKRYPLKASGVRSKIAKSLKFNGYQDYEEVALTQLRSTLEFREQFIQNYFYDLNCEIKQL
jgi:ABC-type Mn2+/Zn2+ transport system ATPase subunit